MNDSKIWYHPSLTQEERDSLDAKREAFRKRLPELNKIKPTRTWTDQPVPRRRNPDGSYEPTAYELWKAEKKRLKADADASAEKPAREDGTES